jgi:hypothetical protein
MVGIALAEPRITTSAVGFFMKFSDFFISKVSD